MHLSRLMRPYMGLRANHFVTKLRKHLFQAKRLLLVVQNRVRPGLFACCHFLGRRPCHARTTSTCNTYGTNSTQTGMPPSSRFARSSRGLRGRRAEVPPVLLPRLRRTLARFARGLAALRRRARRGRGAPCPHSTAAGRRRRRAHGARALSEPPAALTRARRGGPGPIVERGARRAVLGHGVQRGVRGRVHQVDGALQRVVHRGAHR
mmetsp:Transcript_5918/g.11295  ORF Transcript_5918/g.11295 Transcript_5918/m.11295 type:complete len:207 (-) Transcript_5918:1369-1989(-)